MAPEVLSGSYTRACDMWSIGVIAYMMMSGRMPFDGTSEQDVMSKIKLGSFSMESGVWSKVSSESTDFIRSLVRVEPHCRLTADDALGHAWLHGEWTTFQRKHSMHSESSSSDLGRSIVTSLRQYGQYGKLKKAALMVIAHRAKPREIANLRNAFSEIDSNREGVITLQEMRTALTKFGVSTEETHQIFDDLDVDQTGRISYTEFLAATVEAMGVTRDEQVGSVWVMVCRKLGPE